MATLDVITLADAKQELRSTRADQDETIALLVSAVSERLDELCGPIVQRTVTESLQGYGGPLLLRSRPVQSITSVTEYAGVVPTVLAAESNVAQTTNDYLLGTAGMLYRRSYGSPTYWPLGQANVVVEYVAGRYATTADVSAKFRMAARIMVKHFFRFQAATGTQTFGAADSPDVPVIPTYDVPNSVRGLLAGEIQTDVAIA